MDQAVIFLIVAVFIGLRALTEKFKKAEKELESRNPPPNSDTSSAPAPELTEADRRYREIQEEIRRRVAQRQQQQSPTSVPSAPPPRRPSWVPVNMGLPPRTPPQPISTYQRSEPEPPPAIATPMDMPAMTMDASSEAAATEAAAYALPDSATGDTPIQARTRSAPAGSLRALLTSSASVRQAFLLREVLDRPLSLRAVQSGGHENWN